MPTRKVLVVEDDDRMRQALIEYLESAASVRVDAARDGVDALHAVSHVHYDAIILDLMMPHMNGIDFLDSLRIVKPPHEHPACFVITGMPPEDAPAEAILRRFAGLVRRVFRKPVDLTELGRSVEEVWSGEP
jgi:CheY-like chemotaxis protein